MTETSRRHLIAGAGAGVMGTTIALAGGTAAASAATAKPHATSARESVFAVVDHHDGDAVRLLVGEREVVVHDRDLAVRILNAAGGK